MDPHSKVIPFHLHPLGFIEAFVALGADEATLYRRAGINPALATRADAKISYAQQSALIAAGMELCGRPGVGLLTGLLFDWTFFGTVGGVVHCSTTLREAGDAFNRYVMVAQPYYAMFSRAPHGYVDQNGMFVYSLRTFPPGTQNAAAQLFEIEFRLATTLRVWDACGNHSIPNRSIQVCLAYPEPAHADLYKQLPCTSLQFNCAQSTLAAHKDFFTEPFRVHRRRAFEQIIERCEQELNDARLEPTFAAKVRWHVYGHFNKPLSLEQVAEILHVTPRSLTRRLAQEHTTFRDIVHNVRMEITAHHLESSDMSVDAVSEMMGFSSASSLRRAIRNWSGHATGTLQATKKEQLPLTRTRRSAKAAK